MKAPPNFYSLCQMTLVLVFIFLSILDFADYDTYNFVIPLEALCSVWIIVFGIFGWRHLRLRGRILSSVAMTGSALLLASLYVWGAKMTFANPHYGEWQRLEHEAYLAEHSGDLKKAEQVQREFEGKVLSGWFPKHGFQYLELAHVLELEGKFAEEEKVLLAEVSAIEKVEGLQSTYLLNPEERLVFLYHRQNRIRESEDWFKRLQPLLDECESAGAKEKSPHLDYLGFIQSMKENFEDYPSVIVPKALEGSNSKDKGR